MTPLFDLTPSASEARALWVEHPCADGRFRLRLTKPRQIFRRWCPWRRVMWSIEAARIGDHVYLSWRMTHQKYAVYCTKEEL